MNAIERPDASEHDPYFAAYVNLVGEEPVLEILLRQRAELRAVAAAVPVERETFAYAPNKWTIRQVVGHMGDAERIFGLRAFCFTRGEPATLPSFDENGYVALSPSADVPLSELIDEVVQVRDANLAFLRRVDGAGSRRVGRVESGAVSVRAIAYIMAGHVRHHLRVLRDRYGVALPPGAAA